MPVLLYLPKLLWSTLLLRFSCLSLQLLCCEVIPGKHGCVRMHGHKARDPPQEDPKDPGPTPRKQGGPRDRKPTKTPKRAKNTQKHQKHQNAPRKAALGSRQRRQRERERGRAKTESEQNHVFELKATQCPASLLGPSMSSGLLISETKEPFPR